MKRKMVFHDQWRWSFHMAIFFILLLSISSAATADPSRKVDAGVKCSTCPCIDPCSADHSPPPSPPPPPPPATTCCGGSLPPPPPRFIYVTGVPGNLYTTDTTNGWEYFYSTAVRSTYASRFLVAAQVVALLGVVALIN